MGDKRRLQYMTILQHLLFWITLILYQAISYGWENTDQLTFHILPAFLTVSLPITIIITYINLYILMPTYYYVEKYSWYILNLIFLLLAGGIMIRFLTHVFVLPWEQVNDPVRYHLENKNFWIPVRIVRLAIGCCPVMAITMVVQLMRKAYYREKNLRELEQEKFLAEMGLLKAQINPHFFFNTLNTLYGLILKKSKHAAKFALRISDLMHYMLYEARADKVLLTDEISHLENYLRVEEMRFVDSLDISFTYSGNVDGKLIAPLILLPFVENAFKHGSGWITISIKIVANRLYLKVENNYADNGQQKGHGLGLENVKRRLELTYPEKYTFELTANNGTFEIDLKLGL